LDSPVYNIAAVSIDTGIGKETLRMWERRYGFPMPWRDPDSGDRVYSMVEVEKLHLIKQLMAHGLRPGQIVPQTKEELIQLIDKIASAPHRKLITQDSPEISQLLAAIKRHDADGFVDMAQKVLLQIGLERFVIQVVAPLTTMVGELWQKGDLKIYEEHLYTELTKRILRQAISVLPAASDQKIRVITATTSHECHLVGLLMFECLIALEGVHCIPLGSQLPVKEIVDAAYENNVDIVALSFSSAFPKRQLSPLLHQLRLILPADVRIWVGGDGSKHSKAVSGVRFFENLQEVIPAVQEYRELTKDLNKA